MPSPPPSATNAPRSALHARSPRSNAGGTEAPTSSAGPTSKPSEPTRSPSGPDTDATHHNSSAAPLRARASMTTRTEPRTPGPASPREASGDCGTRLFPTDDPDKPDHARGSGSVSGEDRGR